jgi:hypothetical protein
VRQNIEVATSEASEFQFQKERCLAREQELSQELLNIRKALISKLRGILDEVQSIVTDVDSLKMESQLFAAKQSQLAVKIERPKIQPVVTTVQNELKWLSSEIFVVVCEVGDISDEITRLHLMSRDEFQNANALSVIMAQKAAQMKAVAASAEAELAGLRRSAEAAAIEVKFCLSYAWTWPLMITWQHVEALTEAEGALESLSEESCRLWKESMEVSTFHSCQQSNTRD